MGMAQIADASQTSVDLTIKDAASGTNQKTAEQAEKVLESDGVSKLTSEFQKVVKGVVVANLVASPAQDLSKAQSPTGSNDDSSPTVPIVLGCVGALLAMVCVGYFVHSRKGQSERQSSDKRLLGAE